MYYKIINTECEVYKKLRKQREAETKAQEENKKMVEEIVPFKWNKFVGHKGQQTFSRVTEYIAFVPENIKEADLSGWRKFTTLYSPIKDKAYVPNLTTKKGREINKKFKKLKSFDFTCIWDILDVNRVNGRFSLPFVEIVDDILIIFLDESQEPKNPNIIEITKNEFEELLRKKIKIKRK